MNNNWSAKTGTEMTTAAKLDVLLPRGIRCVGRSMLRGRVYLIARTGVDCAAAVRRCARTVRTAYLHRSILLLDDEAVDGLAKYLELQGTESVSIPARWVKLRRGPWTDRIAFVQSVVQNTDELVLAVVVPDTERKRTTVPNYYDEREELRGICNGVLAQHADHSQGS